LTDRIGTYKFHLLYSVPVPLPDKPVSWGAAVNVHTGSENVMRKEDYPLFQFRRLVRRIEQGLLLEHFRHWTGNDEKDHHYHILLPVTGKPVYLNLFWKKGAEAPVHHIGSFELHLKALLSEGYIRSEKEGKVRLRICRLEDGLLYIQKKSGKPALAIGCTPF
jgi:hypothetical protein